MSIFFYGQTASGSAEWRVVWNQKSRDGSVLLCRFTTAFPGSGNASKASGSRQIPTGSFWCWMIIRQTEPQSWCLNWRKRIPEFYRFCVRKTVYPQRATRDWKKRKENLSCLWMRTISWIRRCSLCFGRCWGRQKATLRSVITIDGTVNRAEFITGQRGC